MRRPSSTKTNVHTLHVATLATFLLAAQGCERTTNLASLVGEVMDAGTYDAAQGDALITDELPPAALCGAKKCECDNGKDDDLDGFIDGLDSECTGPYDQDEATFKTGEIKGGNPRCVDCFFDFNAGSGDDGCSIAASCGVTGQADGPPGMCNVCEPNNECKNNCEPRTPNGCDCFGCCEVWSGGTMFMVQLTDSCAAQPELLANERACPRCIRSKDCLNECGRCELCPGKRLSDLPPDCNQGDPLGYTCDNGEVCGDKQRCEDQRYCAQGCCVPVLK